MRPIFFAAILALAACTNGALTPTAQTALATAQSDAQLAINAYGIAKGIAQVATIADPSLAGPVAVATAALDPLVAKAQAALTAASTDAPAIEALAQTISAQAQALMVKTAPVVKVVAS